MPRHPGQHRGGAPPPRRRGTRAARRRRSTDAGARMTPGELLAFMRTHRVAVQASVSAAASAQAAVVGIAITDRFEVVFDTLASSRKATNLRANPAIALVMGGLMPGDERTVQYEGVADEPDGDERDRLTAAYYAVYPDGRDRLGWPGLTYVRVRPRWIRYSDFGQPTPLIVEFAADQLMR
jgi:general stress protein 26